MLNFTFHSSDHQHFPLAIPLYGNSIVKELNRQKDQTESVYIVSIFHWAWCFWFVPQGSLRVKRNHHSLCPLRAQHCAPSLFSVLVDHPHSLWNMVVQFVMFTILNLTYQLIHFVRKISEHSTSSSWDFQYIFQPVCNYLSVVWEGSCQISAYHGKKTASSLLHCPHSDLKATWRRVGWVQKQKVRLLQILTLVTIIF